MLGSNQESYSRHSRSLITGLVGKVISITNHSHCQYRLMTSNLATYFFCISFRAGQNVFTVSWQIEFCLVYILVIGGEGGVFVWVTHLLRASLLTSPSKRYISILSRAVYHWNGPTFV